MIIDKSWAKSFLKRLRSQAQIPAAVSLGSINSYPFDSVRIEDDSDDAAEVSDIDRDSSKLVQEDAKTIQKLC